MSQGDNEGRAVGPFYVAVSALLEDDGLVYFRTLRMDDRGSRLVIEGLGGRRPSCAHLHCALLNVGEVAMTHAYNLADDRGPWEQLPLPMGPYHPCP